MKVILTEDVKKVGKKGDILEFSDAYARNCIINKKLGVEATPANLNNLKLKKANDEKVALEKLEEAKIFAKDLETKTIKTKIKCGENGKTFGSVSSKEICEELKKQHGIDIDKKKILLKEPIRTPGAFEIEVKVHPQVTGKFHIVIEEQR
ncbi:MAG: 50S ribosomal protein L9 [Lachnospiraceae bacterium]|nr:50S ribosomal protein L9 [Lachnospiraceae bacterium]